MMLLKDLPKYETLLNHAKRYPEVDPKGTESFLLMLRTASDIIHSFSEYLERFHMSQGRFTVLMLLNREPETPLTPASLADRAGVTRATMTGLLDGLEEEGLVTRTSQMEDRRKISVALTYKALKLLDTMLPEYFRKVNATMGHLSPAELESLIELMKKLQAGVDGLQPDAVVS